MSQPARSNSFLGQGEREKTEGPGREDGTAETPPGGKSETCIGESQG